MTEPDQQPTRADSAEDLPAILADHQRQLDDLARTVAAQQRMLDKHEATLQPRNER